MIAHSNVIFTNVSFFKETNNKMAYKFQRGPATVSGSFTAEEGLTSNTSVSAVGGNLSGSAQLLVGTSATIGNGLTVTVGNTSVQALTASLQS